METREEPVADRRPAWILAAKLLVTVALLGVLFSRASPGDVAQRLSAVAPATVVAAVGTLLFVVVVIAFRWQIVLRQFGAAPQLLRVVRYTLVGGFFNQVLPSGLGGDAFRVWYARSFGLSTGRALATVVVDRILALFAIAAIVVIGIPFMLWMDAPRALVAAAAVAVGLLVAGIAAFLSLDALEGPLARLLERVAPRRLRGHALRATAGGAATARNSRAMLRAWPRGAIAMAISIFSQLTVSFVVYLLLNAMGQPVALLWVLFLFPFVMLLSMVPISFAGWGMREGAMVVAFRLVGVPREAALGASILFGLCLLLSSLPGALLWLAQRRNAGARPA